MTLNIFWFKVGPTPDLFGGGNDMVSLNEAYHLQVFVGDYMGVCKTPRPFKWLFQTLSFFFLLSFFQVLASHLDQRIHMSEERKKEKEGKKGKGEERKRERKGKGKGKGKESERKRKGKRKEKERKRKRKERKKERKGDRKKERRRKRKSKGRVKEE